MAVSNALKIEILRCGQLKESLNSILRIVECFSEWNSNPNSFIYFKVKISISIRIS